MTDKPAEKKARPKEKAPEKKADAPAAKPKKEAEKKPDTEAKAEPKAPEKVTAPAAEKPAAAAEKPKAKKQKKQKSKAVVARGKRKQAVARATVKPGKGRIRVNKVLLDSYNNMYVREIIREPLRYTGPETNDLDISVTVFGGGSMGQAQAARTAIANALVKYFEGTNLREKFVDIDRSLVVEDIRRVESKKYKGPKARARFQKSYR
jgi:small subunit ribosomal protein S9